MVRQTLCGCFVPVLVGLTLASVLSGSSGAQEAQFDQLQSPSIMRKIDSATDRVEMTVNSSRIFTLDQKIPQAQVNNPDVLDLTPLSPTQVQVFAKTPGVTQVNLWDENDQIYTIDVIVYGDARELSMFLSAEFPNAAIKVKPVSTGVLISGYVDQPDEVASIKEIAEQYYPKVLLHMNVGGVHQVLLHIKVMEVSRTKMRTLGFDWTQLSMHNMVVSNVSGLLGEITKVNIDVDPTTGLRTITSPTAAASSASTFRFDVIDGTNAFFGVLEAMRRDGLAKILAEPTLVTVSGRPAYFQSGGEIPVISGGSTLLAPTTEYKPYGTQVDFVPIVLGNGRIRLEVRPRVSEVDPSRAIGDTPAFRVRQVDTAVEMRAGQTLAIAGLVQNRVESTRRGLPWVSEVPYLGALFRRVEEENNEVELLIFVTPELVDAMDPEDVPRCGPGMQTTSPSDCELYFKGHLEVPNCGPPEAAANYPMEMGQMGPPSTYYQQQQQEFTPGQSPVQATQTGAPVDANNPPVPYSRTSTSETGPVRQLPGFLGPIGYDAGD